MNLQLEITDCDILHGQQRNCEGCPIARAMRRAAHNAFFGHPEYRGQLEVIAKLSKLRITDLDRDLEWVVVTPDFCKRFMNLFDGGLNVEPFTIELEFEQKPANLYPRYQ